MTTPAQPPGWYPDPTGEPQSRYWDGIQWTSSTQFAGLQSPRRTGTGTVVALVAGLTVLAVLLVAGGALLVRTVARGDRDTVAGTAEGPGYTYAEPEQVDGVVIGPCSYSEDGSPARPVSPPTEADLATSGTFELAPDYTPIGRITAGLDVLQQVAAAGSDDSNGSGDGRPRTAVLLEQVTAQER